MEFWINFLRFCWKIQFVIIELFGAIFNRFKYLNMHPLVLRKFFQQFSTVIYHQKSGVVSLSLKFTIPNRAALKTLFYDCRSLSSP